MSARKTEPRKRAEAGVTAPAVRLRKPGDRSEGAAVAAELLLDRAIDPDDEVLTPGGWMPVGDAIGQPGGRWLPEPVKYAALLLWLLALVEGLWMIRLGPQRTLFILAGGALVGGALLVLRHWRWGMAFGIAAGGACAARGVFDIARLASLPPVHWGNWVWAIVPAALGAGGTALAAWWLRSGRESRPVGWRLLEVAHGKTTLEDTARDRRQSRFANVPFGLVAGIAAVAVPYALAFVPVWLARVSAGAARLPSLSPLAFSLLIGAGGGGVIAYGLFVRKATPQACGLERARWREDAITGLGAAGLLVLSAHAVFSLLDALQALLAANATTAGAAAAIGDASAGMAREESASTITLAAGGAWKLWAVAALAAVAEELGFRGGLYAALRRRWGVAISLVGSSVPFALLHFEPYQTAQLVLGGLVLGALYEARRTLWAPIAAHLAWNLFVVASGG